MSKEVLKGSGKLKLNLKGNGWNEFKDDDVSIKLFSIIDGHRGSAAAELLKEALHPAVGLSLASFYRGYKPTTDDPLSTMRRCDQDLPTFLSAHLSFIQDSTEVGAVPSATWTQDGICDVLTAAFLELDYDISSEPLRLISGLPSTLGKIDSKALIARAISGACALTVMVEEDREEVYIANTGDTRAVAGYLVAPETTKDGHRYEGGWRCEVLTEDHTSANPKKLNRYLALWSCPRGMIEPSAVRFLQVETGTPRRGGYLVVPSRSHTRESSTHKDIW